MFAHGETVTVQIAGTVTDPYSGDPTPSWDVDPTEQPIDNILVASGGSTEPAEVARSEVDSDFDLIFQPPVTLTPTAQNRIVVRGLVCDVVGRPFLWNWAASGGEAGLVVQVKIREG